MSATTGDAAAPPTLREAITLVTDQVTQDVRHFALGLGPGNSTSHAAEVLAQGAKNGVSLPEPGPVATELLTGGDAIKFRDAQSSVLGVWGDLGTLGALLYAAVCLLGAWCLVAPLGLRAALRSPRAWSGPVLVGGVLAGGTLLDWPEQASVVLPVMLAVLLVAAREQASASAPPEEREAAVARPSTEPTVAAR